MQNTKSSNPIDWEKTILVRPHEKGEQLHPGERVIALGPEDEGKFAWEFEGEEIVLLMPGDKVVVRDAE
ncbi:MAG TPA: hypothetical protein V6C81_11620 [Planktothrix sp.]|jgi:hypothetical protein